MIKNNNFKKWFQKSMFSLADTQSDDEFDFGQSTGPGTNIDIVTRLPLL